MSRNRAGEDWAGTGLGRRLTRRRAGACSNTSNNTCASNSISEILCGGDWETGGGRAGSLVGRCCCQPQENTKKGALEAVVCLSLSLRRARAGRFRRADVMHHRTTSPDLSAGTGRNDNLTFG